MRLHFLCTDLPPFALANLHVVLHSKNAWLGEQHDRHRYHRNGQQHGLDRALALRFEEHGKVGRGGAGKARHNKADGAGGTGGAA